MPELPEVETIRLGLNKEIINKKIIKIRVNLPKLIKNPEPDQFQSRLENAYFRRISRRGKYLLFSISTTDCLVIHLGMSGLLLYQKDQQNQKIFPRIHPKHNHIIFYFEDNSKLIYNDVRQFGKILVLKKDEKLSNIESLGFEPLECHFTFQKFHEILQKSKGKIKSFLMNQKYITGIGNIYANEILFSAGVHPLRRPHSLTTREAQKIYFYMKKILAKAIALSGTTMIDESYRDCMGNKGQYGSQIMVYGKKKGICPKCGQPLKVIKIDNRSSFVCTVCQK